MKWGVCWYTFCLQDVKTLKILRHRRHERLTSWVASKGEFVSTRYVDATQFGLSKVRLKSNVTTFLRHAYQSSIHEARAANLEHWASLLDLGWNLVDETESMGLNCLGQSPNRRNKHVVDETDLFRRPWSCFVICLCVSSSLDCVSSTYSCFVIAGSINRLKTEQKQKREDTSENQRVYREHL